MLRNVASLALGTPGLLSALLSVMTLQFAG